MIQEHRKLGTLQETDTTWYRVALQHIGDDQIDMMRELDAHFDVVDRNWGCTWGFVKNKTFEELEKSHGKAEYLEQNWLGKNLGIRFNKKYIEWRDLSYDVINEIENKNLPIEICNVGRCVGEYNGERCHASPRNGDLCYSCKKEAERIASGKPKRKPTTCSICKETGHNKSVCEQNPKVIKRKWIHEELMKHIDIQAQDRSHEIPKINELEEEWERMQ